jgi:transcriptional regulator GlxA family with amidase domain
MQSARLVATTDMKINTVALAAGFRSKRHFYVAFHRIVGVSPSDLRTPETAPTERPAGVVLDISLSGQTKW